MERQSQEVQPARSKPSRVRSPAVRAPPAPGRLPLPPWPEKTGPGPRQTLGASVCWRASSFAWGSATPFSPLPNFPRPAIAEPAAVIFRFARRLRAPPRFLFCFWVRLPLGLAEREEGRLSCTLRGETSSSCAFLSLRPMVGGKTGLVPMGGGLADAWTFPWCHHGPCLTCAAARLRRNRMVASRYLLRSDSSYLWVLEMCLNSRKHVMVGLKFITADVEREIKRLPEKPRTADCRPLCNLDIRAFGLVSTAYHLFHSKMASCRTWPELEHCF
jgi:hypothetical protein